LTLAQYDLGEARRGENRGDLTPAQIATIVVASIAVGVALSVTIFFCYYVYKQNEKVEARYG
jgi:hypothetical protein